MTGIMVFGDSIAYGAWDPEGGWVSRLKKRVHEMVVSSPDFYCLVYNLGVSGDTTRGLLERLVPETMARAREGDENVLVLGIGTNDSAIIVDTGLQVVPPGEFGDNLDKLVNLARKHYSAILLLGLPCVDEEKTDPIPWNPSRAYRNQSIKRYEETIEKVARRRGIGFVPLFHEFEKNKRDLLSGDGLHPNGRGHALIGNLVYRSLVDMGVLPLLE